MVFPKPVMSVGEMIEMGFSRDELYQYYHRRGQNYARKTPGGGKIKFDTVKFSRFLDTQNSNRILYK